MSTEKPVDLWLGLGGIAFGIVYWLLVDKTPLTIVGSLFLVFALLAHPVWNFWFIERRLSTRILALCVFTAMLFALGRQSWPKPVEVPNAKIEITNIAASRGFRTDPKHGFFINVYYENRGTLPAKGITTHTWLRLERPRFIR